MLKMLLVFFLICSLVYGIGYFFFTGGKYAIINASKWVGISIFVAVVALAVISAIVIVF